MWVHAIELEHWRLFNQRRMRVGELSPGINLIVGPNEAGKSTLVDAMARLLFDRPKTTSASHLRPWGTEVTPEGALELEAEGQRYRIEKRFHPTSGSALLLLDQGMGFAAFREDEAVQDFVHRLVGGQKVGRGLTRSENWGLLRLLWALQDEDVVPPEPAPEVQERLGPLLGRDPLADPGQVQPLLQEVERRYGLWFTPTGRPAKGSPIAAREEENLRLEAEIAGLEQDLARTRELGQRLKEELEEEKELAAGYAAEEERREELAQASRRYEDLKLLHAQAERRHEAALAEVRQAEQLLGQLKDAGIQLQLHEQQIASAETRLVELRELGDRARAERQEAEARVGAAEEAMAAALAASSAAAARRDAIERLLTRHLEVDRARAEERQALARLQEAEAAEQMRAEQEAAALAARNAAEEQERAARREVEAAAAAVERARQIRERHELAAELERISSLETQIARLVAARAPLRVASEEDLRLLEGLEAEEIRLRATVQAERVALELHAERELRVIVRIDGRLEEEPLSAKAIARYEGAQLRLILPGIATILVGRPGVGEQTAHQLDEIERRKAEVLTYHDAADLEALRTQTQQARQLDREIELRREELRGRKPRSHIEARLAELPQEGLSPELAAERHGTAQAAHKRQQAALLKVGQELESSHGALAWARQTAQTRREDRRGSAARAATLAEQLAAEATALGLEASSQEAIETAVAASVRLAAASERSVKQAQEQLERVRVALAATREKLGGFEKQLVALDTELRNHRLAAAELQTGRLRLLDGCSEPALRERLDTLNAAVEQALRHRARLEELPAVDPRIELQTVESGLKQLRNERDQLTVRQTRLEQELESLGSLGLYERLTAAKERLEMGARELRSEQLKASATRHLKGLIEAAQADERHKLGGPIREWVVVRAREVLGDSYADVLLSSSLQLDLVSRRGLGEPASVADLSRGTRDVLGLLVRLAIAELVSKQERQLVVLDDVLVHADATRRRRLLKILQEAAAGVQILICTCHADQYSGLGEEVRRIDLDALKQERT
jgi:energy-coupling factor transporter ATP-binding protein EcfA2